MECTVTLIPIPDLLARCAHRRRDLLPWARHLPPETVGVCVGRPDQPDAYAYALCVRVGEWVRIPDVAATERDAPKLADAVALHFPNKRVLLVNEPEGSPADRAFRRAGLLGAQPPCQMLGPL